MKTFSIMDAAMEPFRQAGRRPVATTVWGLVLMAPGLLAMGAMLPLMGTILGGLDPADFEPGAGPEAMLFGDDVASMMQFQLWSNLAQLLSFLTLLLATTAIIRAVFAGRKGDGAFFLRIGMAELQVAVVGVAIFIGFFMLALVASLLVVGIGFAVWSLGDPWRWLICVTLGLAVFLALVLLWGRLSLLAPASIRYGTFAFEEGWKLGRGKTWSLLGLGLLLFVMAIVIGMAFMLLFLVVMLAVGGGVQATDPEAVKAWIMGLPEQPWLLAGLVIVLLIPMAWIQGFSQMLFTAPYAHVVQALAGSGDPEAVAEEFH